MSFLWGASTSAHQTEGNNTNSDWWWFERRPNTPIPEPSGDALDSYYRWNEDMDLLARAGFTDYRFSIEWARIEPAPGEFSDSQIEHYRRMVDGARERGLRPMVTLHHFTNPRWFHVAGSWAATDAVDLFVRYVKAVTPVIESGVDHVCTINEPNIAALFPSYAQAATPGTVPDQVWAKTLTSAHHAARDHLKATLPHIDVGWSVALLNLRPEPGAEEACAEYTYPRETVFLEAARSDDWIGVQAYTRNFVGLRDGTARQLPVAEGVDRTLNGWEYYPPALGEAVRETARVLPDVPIIVTENGIATDDDAGRIAYTTGALQSLRDAMSDGVDVRGYLHWSLLDNYEWGSYRPTFGLVSVDRATFARSPKPSFGWLGSFTFDQGD